MKNYHARLATRITVGVDARLRQLALLRRQRINRTLDDLLDQALPSSRELTGRLALLGQARMEPLMAAGEQNGRRRQPFGIPEGDYGGGRHREVKVINLRLTGGPDGAGGWLRGALIARKRDRDETLADDGPTPLSPVLAPMVT